MADIGSSNKDYKKYFLISAVSLIVVLILVISVYLFVIKPKYAQYYDEKMAECLAKNQEQYNLMMAVKTGDKSYCTKLPAARAQACAEGKADATVCENLPETEKNTCRAEFLKNPGLCQKDDAWCLALASGDEKYCQQLKDIASKNECITKVRMDADSLISDQAKKDCADSAYLYAFAMTQDKAVCDKIINPEIRKSCLG